MDTESEPHLALFDRFEKRPSHATAALVRDITDLLGARRLHPGAVSGLMAWGLSNTVGVAPSSATDRKRIAGQIADQLRRFEPRLRNVSVAPVRDAGEFAFRIDAHVVAEDGGQLVLRVVAPRRGGGLGADVVLMGARP